MSHSHVISRASHAGKSVGQAQTQYYTFAEDGSAPFVLENGESFGPITIAYETYGTLNAAGNNAILLFHAMTGSQHAAGVNLAVEQIGTGVQWNESCQSGWWDNYIGPGRALDTQEFFIVCANWLGGCYGTTGPASLNPKTGRPYGSGFPTVTIGDVVNTQARLLDHLGVKSLISVIGGSLGGVCAMEFAVRFPHMTRSVIPIAAGAKATTLHKLHNFEQIFAIEEDPHFNFGDYYDGPPPRMGLILARMIAHKSFVHLEVMEERAKGEIVQQADDLKGYRLCHQIESYMLHQGKRFTPRFDANSYLRILSMWQEFDISRFTGGDFVAAFERCRAQSWLVFSIESDVCFWPEQQAELCQFLQQAGVGHQHITVHSLKGHDSFLLEPELYRPHIHFMLQDVFRTITTE